MNTNIERNAIRFKDLLVILPKSCYVWLRMDGKDISPNDIAKYKDHYVTHLEYGYIDEDKAFGYIITVSNTVEYVYTPKI